MSLQIPPLEHFPPTNTYKRADDVIAFCNDYVAKHFPFDTDADRERFIKLEIPAYACKVVSFATNHEKMCKVSLLIVFYLFLDDRVDRDGMELDKKAILALLPPPDDLMVIKPGDSGQMSLFDISAELYGNIRTDIPPADYDRMVSGMKEYLRAQNIAPGYSSIEELLELRVSEAGANVLYSYICYAMELSVTDNDLEDPLYKRCQNLGSEAGVLRNDVSSYIKEVNEGSAQNNIITKIQEWSACSEDDARSRVLSIISDRQAELHATCTQALGSPHLSLDAKRFVVAIPYMVGGNTWWHHHSSRYAEGRGDVIEP